MKRFLNLHFMIAFHLVVLAILITSAAWFAHTAKAEVRHKIEENIDRQLVRLTELADTTDRNGADETVSAIISDCQRRGEFEILLGKLGTLPQKELIEVQQLFESCGNFYAEQKALMVSKFGREYEVFKDNADLLMTLDRNVDMEEELSQWNRVIALEQERSGLLAEQTVLQQDIITALLEGNKINSQVIGDLVLYAQKIGESLGVIDKQIDGIRTELDS